jgi:hypothetical protein
MLYQEATEICLEIINRNSGWFQKINFPMELNRQDFNNFRENILNADVNQIVKDKSTLMMVIIENNKSFQLENEKIKKLLNDCNINADTNNWTLFTQLLIQNEEKNIFLTKNELLEYWQKCSEENKEKTFYNLCSFENILDKEDKKKIFLLYDCGYQLSDNFLKFLQEKKPKIVELVKKRDLFFQLNQKTQNIQTKKQKIKI